MKIKTTFLNDVQKKIYINKPKDFTELGKENKVWFKTRSKQQHEKCDPIIL